MTSSPGKKWTKQLRQAQRLQKRMDQAMQKAQREVQKADQKKAQAKKKLSKGFFGLARALPALGLIMLLGAVFGAMDN